MGGYFNQSTTGAVVIGFVIPAYNTSLISARSTSSQITQAIKDGLLRVNDTKGEEAEKLRTISKACVVCDALKRPCSQHTAIATPKNSDQQNDGSTPFTILSPFRTLFSPKTPVSSKKGE